MSTEHNKVPDSDKGLYDLAQNIVDRFDGLYDFTCIVERMPALMVEIMGEKYLPTEEGSNILRVLLKKTMENFFTEISKEGVDYENEHRKRAERALSAKTETNDTLNELENFVNSDQRTVRIIRKEITRFFPDFVGIVDMEVRPTA